MREPPNQLHTSSNTDNNLCAHLLYLFSQKCKDVCYSFLVDLFGRGILQNKGCLNSVSTTILTGVLSCLETNRNGLQKGQATPS